ncbi:MAG: hypothetical protein V4467_03980 [Patescibacteria group bacterium]
MSDNLLVDALHTANLLRGLRTAEQRGHKVVLYPRNPRGDVLSGSIGKVDRDTVVIGDKSVDPDDVKFLEIPDLPMGYFSSSRR